MKRIATIAALWVTLLGLLPQAGFSQNTAPESRTIKGKVVLQRENTPLGNVSVQTSKSKTGTVTAEDGTFTIVLKKGETLRFSRVDLQSETVSTFPNQSLTVQMQQAENNLEDVLVVAYSNQRKKTFTGSVGTIKNSVIESAPNASVQETMQGNIAGVQSTNGSGQPGSVPNVRIRGVGSINASAAPLYVIDGIPVVSGDISGLNMNSNTIAGLNANDIENLTVLKDASATSLYGSRGANGVILITTKKGKAGKTKLGLIYQRGVTSNTIREEQKTLTTPQYLQYYKEGWVNAGNRATSFDSLLAANSVDPTVNTDWFDKVLRQGNYSQYNLNASGGSDKTTYFLSGSYYKSDAPTKNIDYDKATYRVNINSEVAKSITIKGGISGSYQRTSNFLGGSSFGNPVRAMYRLAPWLPVYKSDGTTYELGYNSGYNPVAVLETTKRNAKTYNISAVLSPTIRLAKGLTFEGNYALDFNHAFTSIFYDPRVGNANVAAGGVISNYSQDIVNWITTNIVRYKTTFKDDHSFELFAGIENQSRSDMDINIEVNGIAPGTNTPAGGSSPVLTTGTATGNRIMSKFLNGNYSYNDRFFVSGSIREDASSRFAKNFQSAVFWSVGAGWNISNEKFFNVDWVKDLKLRASYGYTGNQGIDNFESQGLYSAGSDYDFRSGLTLSQLANDNLTWEKNIPFNIGLDFALAKGRFSGSIEYYNRVSSNLLISQPVPSVNGVSSITVNSGAMRNSGMELTLSSINIAPTSARGLKWTTDFNITTNRNRVTELDPSYPSGSYLRRVGYDFYTHFQRAYAGVNPENGEQQWFTNAAKDSTTNVFTTALPRQAFGSASPKFYGGLTNSFTYHGIGLSFQFYAFWGNTIYDEYGYLQKTDANLGFSDQSNGLSRYEYERRWTTVGQKTDVPKPIFLGPTAGSSPESSRFLYNGSYVRLRDVTLSYTIAPKMLSKWKINTARIYMRAQNLFTITKDKRFNTDPEVSVDGVLSQRPPVFRTVLLGIDINL
jgi:TonB-dependent starch-binding outer membrane protein SusC